MDLVDSSDDEEMAAAAAAVPQRRRRRPMIPLLNDDDDSHKHNNNNNKKASRRNKRLPYHKSIYDDDDSSDSDNSSSDDDDEMMNTSDDEKDATASKSQQQKQQKPPPKPVKSKAVAPKYKQQKQNNKKKSRDSLLLDDSFLSDSDSSFEKLLDSLKITPHNNASDDEEEIQLTDHWGNSNTASTSPSYSTKKKKKKKKKQSLFLETNKKTSSAQVVETKKQPTKQKAPPSYAAASVYNVDSSSSSDDDDASSVDTSNSNENGDWKLDERRRDYVLTCSSTNTTTTAKYPKLSIPARLFGQLYEHQKSGVQFLASLHTTGIGGVLGDDMGMGKTYMTLTYLGGLFRTGVIRNALIVAPVSVLQSWEKEARHILKLCAPYICIQKVSSSSGSKNQRVRVLTDATARSTTPKTNPHLVITTYGMVREMTAFFNKHGYFDYVCLDEGHTIKNANSLISQACRTICRHRKTHRLLLSGTPIMNNLKELWAVFDWATSGQVLGELQEFTLAYARKIEDARDIHASDSTIRAGERANTQLQEILRPHFLQRLKVDFLSDLLPTKTELVLWTHLSAQQRAMYNEYVNAKEGTVRSILRGEKTSPLEAITFLKKLCGHPLLIEQPGDDLGDALPYLNVDAILAQSTKLQILCDLVDRLRRGSHKTLVFSQSTRMLDIIQKVLPLPAASVARIDGSTRERDRQVLVDEFNSKHSCFHVMLLSTKAAGIGLTLTGADRVIVYDPSWTPAEDRQAVDRCYRIGQKKEVLVYRMIAAGTVEEKMYEKQIHKDGIRRTVFTEGTEIQRYFATHELKQLFALADPGVCKVMEKVQDVNDTDWSRFRYVLKHQCVVGLSCHAAFYNPATAPEKVALLEENEHSVTVVGRAQRILSKNEHVSSDAVPLGRNNKTKRSAPPTFEVMDDSSDDDDDDSYDIPDSVFASGKSKSDLGSAFVGDDKQNYNNNRNKENALLSGGGHGSSSTSKANSNVARATTSQQQQQHCSASTTDILARANKLVALGQPRRSMKVLLDLVQNRRPELDEAQFDQVHRQIGELSSSLGLLESSSTTE